MASDSSLFQSMLGSQKSAWNIFISLCCCQSHDKQQGLEHGVCVPRETSALPLGCRASPWKMPAGVQVWFSVDNNNTRRKACSALQVEPWGLSPLECWVSLLRYHYFWSWNKIWRADSTNDTRKAKLVNNHTQDVGRQFLKNFCTSPGS